MRPTSDRVRGAILNALGSRIDLFDTEVLDLFAGTGALGIEALSRGAGHCTFLDTSAASIRSVEANLQRTNLAARATVCRVDALGYLTLHPRRVDVAFADPPYVFDRWRDLFERVDAEVFVAESDRPVFNADWGLDRWKVLSERRYGGTVVTLAVDAATAVRDVP